MVEFTFILNVGSVVNDVGFFKKLLVIFDVVLVSFLLTLSRCYTLIWCLLSRNYMYKVNNKNTRRKCEM